MKFTEHLLSNCRSGNKWTRIFAEDLKTNVKFVNQTYRFFYAGQKLYDSIQKFFLWVWHIFSTLVFYEILHKSINYLPRSEKFLSNLRKMTHRSPPENSSINWCFDLRPRSSQCPGGNRTNWQNNAKLSGTKLHPAMAIHGIIATSVPPPAKHQGAQVLILTTFHLSDFPPGKV